LSGGALYVAIGILGATVMPHNLYLHSALVQTRSVEQSDEGKRDACRYNFIDTAVALNAAFFVNAAILIVSAAVFYRRGVIVTEIQQAHELLTPLLGTTLASTLFAVALLSAGQSSTLTGTLAGQIVMEGFLQFKIRPVLRRLITRSIAIIPAILVIALQGEEGTYGLLIFSQVILSLQLPFAVIPLIQFTSERSRMGEFTSPLWVRVLAWASAAVIVGLNGNLVVTTVAGWIEGAGPDAIWLWVTVVPTILAVGALLVYIAVPRTWRKRRIVRVQVDQKIDLTTEAYKKIGVALDFGDLDNKVLSHAQTLARQHGASVALFHVVEGVSGQLYGKDAYDDEARKDLSRLEDVAAQMKAAGIDATPVLGFGRVPEQLVALSRSEKIDLLVVGGHRHRGIKDLFFGATVSEVRHQLSIPVFVVQ
jgi:manganese transport protein